MQIPGQECALAAIVVFIIIGFQRGWRRELVSLVFIMLATLLVNKDTSGGLGTFLGRLPADFAYITGGTPPTGATQANATSFLGGPFWSLVIFLALVALGYYIGNRVFPRPATPQERFIGIVPAIVAGAFFITYMANYLHVFTTTDQQGLVVNLGQPDPATYVPIVVVIGIIALVAALIAARVKRAPSGKK